MKFYKYENMNLRDSVAICEISVSATIRKNQMSQQKYV